MFFLWSLYLTTRRNQIYFGNLQVLIAIYYTTTNQTHFYVKPRSRFYMNMQHVSKSFLIFTKTDQRHFFTILLVVLSLLTLAPLLLFLNSSKYFLLNLLEVRVFNSVTLARHALVAAPVICTLFFYLLLLVQICICVSVLKL